MSPGGTFCEKLRWQFYSCLERQSQPLSDPNHGLFQPLKVAVSMLRFGQHLIKPSVVFLRTELCFALVNRRPVVPGRILSMADPGKAAHARGAWKAR